MSESPRRESPLAEFYATELGGREPGEAGCELQERPFLGHLNLRGDPADAAFLEAVKGVVGFGLPLQPNTIAGNPELIALWLGPNEWLLLTPRDQQARIGDALRTALGDMFAAVTDVSDGQTMITVRGAHARDVLGKGCSLDLHPRVFGAGRCAQTLLARAGVVIRQRDDSPSFDVIVRRSFADYLARWLKDAAREYGVRVIPPPAD
ncbi:MAG TPA: sarcosine oxidase subunit gamma family protein [Vicinamibacteria bacterium]|nr:sarcosine oxidase subunit gamma family protein [Vicinamibacteria bacterium]